MKIVKKINTENVLTIDIETVRDYEELKDAPIEVQSAWENKNKKEGVVPEFDLLSELYKQKAPLYPEFSKICSISVGYLSGGTILKVKTYFGKDEATILKNFTKDLTMFCSFNPSYVLCGHAAKFFDYPFICRRLIINGMDLPSILDETDKKPWEMSNIDTNELWKSFGTSYGATLESLCMALKIPISKADLVGDEVGTAYFNDEVLRIAEYCSRDVVSTFNILRKLKKESTFTFDEVEYIFQEGEVKDSRSVNVIDHIRASGELTTKIEDKIVEWVESEKESPQNTFDIVKAAVLSKNPKTENNYFQALKEALGLTKDLYLIQVVLDKGNLGVTEVNQLVLQYGDSEEEVKEKVVKLTKQFLIDEKKTKQKRASESFKLLKEKLLN